MWALTYLKLLDEASATAVTTTADHWSSNFQADRTQLVDQTRSWFLSFPPSTRRVDLPSYIFTFNQYRRRLNQRQTRQVLVCPSTDISDKHAEAKLRLVIEHTRSSISAYPGAASWSVELPKDSVDYTGSISRMWFDMLVDAV